MKGTKNSAELIGRHGRDPNVRVTADGKKICRFNLATNFRKNGSDNKPEIGTDWHKVVIWDGLAETAEKILNQGDLVFVRGPIKTRSWEDEKTKEQKVVVEIHAHEFELLAKKKTDQQVESHA